MTAAGAPESAPLPGRPPVLVAVTGAPWESELVAALGAEHAGLSVVRRCVDLADLLATATTTVVTAALVWPGLRRLDRDALRRLTANAVAVVGVVTVGSAAEEETAHALGIAVTVSSGATGEELRAGVAAAVDRLPAASRPGRQGPTSDGRTGLPRDPSGSHTRGAPRGDAEEPSAQVGPREGPGGPDRTGPPATGAEAAARGRLIAVWGPTGAPGRTTIAVGVASELARLGVETVLADADVYGGTVAPALGLLDEAPGLVAAARLANGGRLTAAGIAGVSRAVKPGLRVLTGIARAGRWPELRVAAVEEVWDRCRELVPVTVVDLGFCIEQDEEIVFDTAAPRRNGVTLMTLECADVVLAVGSADPLGVIRFVHALDDLREAAPAVAARVVMNRVPTSALGGGARRQVRNVVYEHTGVAPFAEIPDDRAACAAAAAAGKTLGEAAASSSIRAAMQELAVRLADVGAGGRGRRRGRTLFSRGGRRSTVLRTG